MTPEEVHRELAEIKGMLLEIKAAFDRFTAERKQYWKDESGKAKGGYLEMMRKSRVKPYLDEDIPASDCLQYVGLKRIERNKREPLAWVQDFCDGFTSWPPNTMSVISNLERRVCLN